MRHGFRGGSAPRGFGTDFEYGAPGLKDDGTRVLTPDEVSTQQGLTEMRTGAAREDELKKFAAGILERFYNPFIKHMLRSISLNSLSKWEARNYPTVRDNWFKAQRLAEREAFTFAALMTLYGPNSGFEPDDTREFVDYICANWDSADMEATIAKIVKESGIFTVDFSEVPGFIPAVAGYVRDIEALGMEGALAKFLKK